MPFRFVRSEIAEQAAPHPGICLLLGAQDRREQENALLRRYDAKVKKSGAGFNWWMPVRGRSAEVWSE